MIPRCPYLFYKVCVAKVKDRWVIVALDASTYRCRGRTNAASLGIDTPLQTNGFAL